MRTVVAWTDSVPDHEGEKQVVWDLAFKPDGTQLVVAVGRRLVVYNANTGEVMRQKVAHGKDVFTVSVSREGAYIASGGADRAVSVWSWDLQQKYTFSHAESVQALAFNPVTANILATASCAVFSIWTMPSASLRKIKLPARACCASWTSDGQLLALGLITGLITVRDLTGAERFNIKRSAPVWDLCWAPAKGIVAGDAATGEPADLLTVACWDSTLSFYTAGGVQVGKDRPAPNGGDPCSVRVFGGGDYLLVSGSDRKASLVTRDGIKLNTVAEGKGWLWRAAPRPKSNAIAIASNDGTVSVHNIVFSTVHGLYGDRYAFREFCTDVVVQHLVSEARVRIKCRDYVKKIAVFKDRIAVQLPDRIIVYESVPVPAPAAGAPSAASTALVPAVTGASSSPASTMMYRVKARIQAVLDCNLLVVTSAHVVLCLEKKLALYSFAGVKEREWVLEAVIRYIKVIGGPPGGEGLLVGLKNGSVQRVFLNNPFPGQLVRHKSAIRCLDISMSRSKLAIVDEASGLYVYDCASGEPVWSEQGATSVAWNAEFEDMLGYSGGGMLTIKTGTFPLHQQKLPGFVVGFSSARIFCLHSVAMQTVEVPQSASLHRYIEAADWGQAYRVACLGITPADWRALGEAALRALQLGVARAAFLRAAPLDMRYIELINHIESSRAKAATTKGGPSMEATDASVLAEVLAYAGRYSDAAKLHLKAGTVPKAIEMFTDLRLWQEARRFAEESAGGGVGRVDVTSLLLKQAAWCEDSGDVKAAATIYAGLGQASRAVTLLADRNLHGPLIDLVRTLPSAPTSSILLLQQQQAMQHALRRNSTSGNAGGGRDRSDSLGSTGSVDLTELLGEDEGSSGSLARDTRDALSAAGAHFSRAGLVPQARETYSKLGDVRALLQLHIDAGQWAEAHALAAATEAEVRTRLGLPSAASAAAAATTAAAVAGAPSVAGAGAAEPKSAAAHLTPLQSRELAAVRALVGHVHLARGEALAAEDRFEDALRAFEAGGRPDLAARILSHLAGAALEEDRYADASLHYRRLARDAWGALERAAATAAARSVRAVAAAAAPPGAPGGAEGRAAAAAAAEAAEAVCGALAARYRRFAYNADVYGAYAVVFTYTSMPFTTATPTTVFNAARFVLNTCMGATAAPSGGSPPGGAPTAAFGRVPHRVSVVRVLYALARQALPLGAHRLARVALDTLSASLLVPPAWRDSVDALSLAAQAKPFSDKGDLAPLCPRCGATGPLITAKAPALVAARPCAMPRAAAYQAIAGTAGGAVVGAGRALERSDGGEEEEEDAPFRDVATSGLSAVSGDACLNCGALHVRSWLTYELLPLVEFVPEKGMSMEAALVLLAEDPPVDVGGSGSGAGAAVLGSGGVETRSAGGDSQTLTFGSGAGAGVGGGGAPGLSGEARFKALMASSASGAAAAAAGAGAAAERGRVIVPADVLRALRPSDIFIIHPPLQHAPAGGHGVGGGHGSGGGSSSGSGGAQSAPALGSGSIQRLAGSSGFATALPSLAEARYAPPRLLFHVSPADVPVALCNACGACFNAEDFEYEVLSRGCCPACKAPAERVGL